MWVIYEDLVQMDERKWLMTLLTNTTGDKVLKVSRNRLRRSTRLVLSLLVCSWPSHPFLLFFCVHCDALTCVSWKFGILFL